MMDHLNHSSTGAGLVGLGSKLAIAWAGAFVAAGILGFVPNPIVGPEALFAANAPHNLVHGVTGLAFLLVMRRGNVASIRFMKVFGVAYMLVGVIGTLVTVDGGSGQLLGLVHINAADNYLHMALGVGILISGVWADTHARLDAFRPRIVTES